MELSIAFVSESRYTAIHTRGYFYLYTRQAFRLPLRLFKTMMRCFHLKLALDGFKLFTHIPGQPRKFIFAHTFMYTLYSCDDAMKQTTVTDSATS